MNLIVLQGRLVRNPELTVKGDKKWGRFTLAVNRMTGNDADFINCVAFGKTSQIIADYTQKGQQIIVEGRLQMNRYENSGEVRTSYDVVVNRFYFCGSKAKCEEPSAQHEVYQSVESDSEFPF